jgi:hypothetical protein
MSTQQMVCFDCGRQMQPAPAGPGYLPCICSHESYVKDKIECESYGDYLLRIYRSRPPDPAIHIASVHFSVGAYVAGARGLRASSTASRRFAVERLANKIAAGAPYTITPYGSSEEALTWLIEITQEQPKA